MILYFNIGVHVFIAIRQKCYWFLYFYLISVALLNSLFISNRFFGRVFGIILLAEREFYLFFSHLYVSYSPFSSFCTSSTFQHCVDKGSDSGHPCFVPSLWEKAFSPSPVSMMLAGGFMSMFFIKKRFPSYLFF